MPQKYLMRIMLLLAVTVSLAMSNRAAVAVEPSEMLSDPALEASARSLSKELRCLVCRNQSIDDSDADLARDLRILIRQRLTEGKNIAAIKNEIVAHYGDYVLLSPPFNGQSWFLWVAPFLVLVLAFGVAFLLIFGREAEASPVPSLTLSEKVRLEGLLRRHDREERQRNQ